MLSAGLIWVQVICRRHLQAKNCFVFRTCSFFLTSYHVCPQTRLSVRPPACPSDSLSAFVFLSSLSSLPAPSPPFCLPWCLSSCMSSCLSARFCFPFQSVFPACPKLVFLPICLFECLSSYMYICLSLCFLSFFQSAYPETHMKNNSNENCNTEKVRCNPLEQKLSWKSVRHGIEGLSVRYSPPAESLSKTLYPLFCIGSLQEYPSLHD